jgi:hypothetical protein
MSHKDCGRRFPHPLLSIHGVETGRCLTRRELFRLSGLEFHGERFSSTPTMNRGILPAALRSRVVYRTRCAMDWETEPITSFETIVHRDCSNPRRIGCPGRDSLFGLTVCLGGAQSALVLAHIRQCAPCFDALKELRKKRSGGNVRQR